MSVFVQGSIPAGFGDNSPGADPEQSLFRYGTGDCR